MLRNFINAIEQLQESSNAERLAIEKKKLEEEAKKKAELEEEQRRIAAENAAKKYAFVILISPTSYSHKTLNSLLCHVDPMILFFPPIS